jgi:hypothetical protein
LLISHERKVEAAGRLAELFPNLSPADAQRAQEVVRDDAVVEDEAACYAGAAFTQEEHAEEWMEWVEWGDVPADGAAGPSGA